MTPLESSRRSRVKADAVEILDLTKGNAVNFSENGVEISQVFDTDDKDDVLETPCEVSQSYGGLARADEKQ